MLLRPTYLKYRTISRSLGIPTYVRCKSYISVKECDPCLQLVISGLWREFEAVESQEGDFQREKAAKEEFLKSLRDLKSESLRDKQLMALKNQWLRTMPLMVLFLVLLLPLCRGKYDRRVVTDKDMMRRKEACYIDIDNGLWGKSCRSSWIAKENCSLRCVSAACYDSVYGEDSLEEGEVDFKRGREYRACLRRELLDEAKGVR